MFSILCFRFSSKLFSKYAFVAFTSAFLTYVWLRCKEENDCVQVLMYCPPNAERRCRCVQKVNANCKDVNCSIVQTSKIIKCLQQAEKSIDICMFSISHKYLSNEIISAHNRGVLIRIVVSNCILMTQSKELQRFRNAGIIIIFQKDWKNSYMHNKYAIVDNKWLIQGSLNWTHQGTFYNWENVIIVDCPSLVEAYSKNFQKIWQTIQL